MVRLLIPALLVSASVRAQLHEYDSWDETYTAQALLGAVQFEDLKLDVADSTQPKEIDFSTLPQLGGAWTTLPRGERFQYGLEASFLLGFKFDKINYLYLGGDGARVSVSTSMWLFDLAGGAYANLFLDAKRRIRLYGGAGPLIMYADYRADRDFDDEEPDEIERESASGLGLYARAGIEFRTHERGMFGVGARGTWSDIDLTDIGGTSDLSGIAIFASFTAGF